MSSCTDLCTVRAGCAIRASGLRNWQPGTPPKRDHLYQDVENREYAARGLAFTYSETDEDFDSMPYVWKVPADESPIDIARLIEFQRSLSVTPPEIRESVRPLSWKARAEGGEQYKNGDSAETVKKQSKKTNNI